MNGAVGCINILSAAVEPFYQSKLLYIARNRCLRNVKADLRKRNRQILLRFNIVLADKLKNFIAAFVAHEKHFLFKFSQNFFCNIS